MGYLFFWITDIGVCFSFWDSEIPSLVTSQLQKVQGFGLLKLGSVPAQGCLCSWRRNSEVQAVRVACRGQGGEEILSGPTHLCGQQQPVGSMVRKPRYSGCGGAKSC